MNPEQSIYLDETILLILAGQAPEKSELIKVLEEYLEQEWRLYSSVVALQEVGVYFTHQATKSDRTEESVLKKLREYLRLAGPLLKETLSCHAADYTDGLEYMEMYRVSNRVALQGAIAYNNNISSIMSLDADYKRIPGLRLIRPI